MSIITREQQKQILIDTANHVINRDNTSPHSENLRELARIALASLEAEAVAWRYRYVHTPKTEEHGSPFTTEWKLCDSEDECNPSDCFERQPLYTAPPAPVSVPDRSMFEKWWESEHGSPLDSWDSLRTTDGYCDDGIDGQFEAWNACRAAMLQGAEPVTTAYKLPDDFDFDRFNDVVWLEAVASNPHMHSPTTSTIAMVALELNRKLSEGNSPVIPGGLSTVCADAYQVVGVMADALGIFDDVAVQKVMDNLSQQKLVHSDVLPFSLPSAPQQEVKP